MTDFLVTAPDLPTLHAVASQIPGLWVPESTDAQSNVPPAHMVGQGDAPALGGWMWLYIGTWMVPTGQTTNDPFGNPQPIMGPKDSNVYGILRWNGDLATMPLPPGVSIVTGSKIVNGFTIPTYTINAGPVTLTFPLPDGLPVVIG